MQLALDDVLHDEVAEQEVFFERGGAREGEERGPQVGVRDQAVRAIGTGRDVPDEVRDREGGRRGDRDLALDRRGHVDRHRGDRVAHGDPVPVERGLVPHRALRGRNWGRDTPLSKCSTRPSTGMPIVACAGFYSQPYYPKEISTMSEDAIVKAIMDQIAAAPTGALGEIGSWDEMTKDERKVFRAVGRAHVATNLPVFTHTGIPGKAAIEQLDILEDQGVDPRRVLIGHLGNLTDPQVYVHKQICRRGAFVGFDRQGNNDTPQVPLVSKLMELQAQMQQQTPLLG